MRRVGRPPKSSQPKTTSSNALLPARCIIDGNILTARHSSEIQIVRIKQEPPDESEAVVAVSAVVNGEFSSQTVENYESRLERDVDSDKTLTAADSDMSTMSADTDDNNESTPERENSARKRKRSRTFTFRVKEELPETDEETGSNLCAESDNRVTTSPPRKKAAHQSSNGDSNFVLDLNISENCVNTRSIGALSVSDLLDKGNIPDTLRHFINNGTLSITKTVTVNNVSVVHRESNMRNGNQNVQTDQSKRSFQDKVDTKRIKQDVFNDSQKATGNGNEETQSSIKISDGRSVIFLSTVHDSVSGPCTKMLKQVTQSTDASPSTEHEITKKELAEKQLGGNDLILNNVLSRDNETPPLNVRSNTNSCGTLSKSPSQTESTENKTGKDVSLQTSSTSNKIQENEVNNLVAQVNSVPLKEEGAMINSVRVSSTAMTVKHTVSKNSVQISPMNLKIDDIVSGNCTSSNKSPTSENALLDRQSVSKECCQSISEASALQNKVREINKMMPENNDNIVLAKSAAEDASVLLSPETVKANTVLATGSQFSENAKVSSPDLSSVSDGTDSRCEATSNHPNLPRVFKYFNLISEVTEDDVLGSLNYLNEKKFQRVSYDVLFFSNDTEISDTNICSSSAQEDEEMKVDEATVWSSPVNSDTKCILTFENFRKNVSDFSFISSEELKETIVQKSGTSTVPVPCHENSKDISLTKIDSANPSSKTHLTSTRLPKRNIVIAVASNLLNVNSGKPSDNTVSPLKKFKAAESISSQVTDQRIKSPATNDCLDDCRIVSYFPCFTSQEKNKDTWRSEVNSVRSSLDSSKLTSNFVELQKAGEVNAVVSTLESSSEKTVGKNCIAHSMEINETKSEVVKQGDTSTSVEYNSGSINILNPSSEDVNISKKAEDTYLYGLSESPAKIPFFEESPMSSDTKNVPSQGENSTESSIKIPFIKECLMSSDAKNIPSQGGNSTEPLEDNSETSIENSLVIPSNEELKKIIQEASLLSVTSPNQLNKMEPPEMENKHESIRICASASNPDNSEQEISTIKSDTTFGEIEHLKLKKTKTVRQTVLSPCDMDITVINDNTKEIEYVGSIQMNEKSDNSKASSKKILRKDSGSKSLPDIEILNEQCGSIVSANGEKKRKNLGTPKLVSSDLSAQRSKTRSMDGNDNKLLMGTKSYQPNFIKGSRKSDSAIPETKSEMHGCNVSKPCASKVNKIQQGVIEVINLSDDVDEISKDSKCQRKIRINRPGVSKSETKKTVYIRNQQVATSSDSKVNPKNEDIGALQINTTGNALDHTVACSTRMKHNVIKHFTDVEFTKAENRNLSQSTQRSTVEVRWKKSFKELPVSNNIRLPSVKQKITCTMDNVDGDSNFRRSASISTAEGNFRERSNSSNEKMQTKHGRILEEKNAPKKTATLQNSKSLEESKVALRSNANVRATTSTWNQSKISTVAVHPKTSSSKREAHSPFKKDDHVSELQNQPSEFCDSDALKREKKSQVLFSGRKGSQASLTKYLHKNVGKRFMNVNDLTSLILEWNPKWLLTQRETKKCAPICDSYESVKDSYKNESEYYNTYFPLHLLSIWLRISESWKKQPMEFESLLEDITEKPNYTKITCSTVLSLESFNSWPKREDIVMCSAKFDGCVEELFGRVCSVIAKDYVLPENIANLQGGSNVLKRVKFNFFCAESLKIPVLEKIQMRILYNIRIPIQQNNALQKMDSRMKEMILDPRKYHRRLNFISLVSHRNPAYDSCIVKIFDSVESAVHHVTIVDTTHSRDEVLSIADLAFKLIKEHSPLLIASRSEDAFLRLAKLLKSLDVVLAVKKKEVKLPDELKMLSLEERSCVTPAREISKNMHAVLTLLSSMYTGDHGDAFADQSWTCIVHEAHLCTETETALILCRKVKHLVLMGNHDIQTDMHPALKRFGYNTSLYSRFRRAQ